MRGLKQKGGTTQRPKKMYRSTLSGAGAGAEAGVKGGTLELQQHEGSNTNHIVMCMRALLADGDGGGIIGPQAHSNSVSGTVHSGSLHVC
jgi:hypothetical protein